MPRTRPFAQVDVFGATAYRGNPVAVVLDATEVADEDMQLVARWTNLSETTFVLPPTTPEADYLVRIFTPDGELPFAGHPTLGTAHAWLEAGGEPRDEGRVVQQCAGGLIQVRRGDALAFAAPPLVRSGPVDHDDLADVSAALGVDPARLVAHQWVDNGPGWAAVRLSSAQEVLALEPDLTLAPDAKIGVVGFHPEGSDRLYEVRALVPGLGEDPVTGSLNAGIAQWLVGEGEVPAVYRVSQGARVGRDGVVEIEVTGDGTIWVGGSTTTLIQGEVSLQT